MVSTHHRGVMKIKANGVERMRAGLHQRKFLCTHAKVCVPRIIRNRAETEGWRVRQTSLTLALLLESVLQSQTGRIALMRTGLAKSSNKRRCRRLARVMAVFFLLYTGADIFLPQYFCAGEELGILPIHASAANLPDIKSAERSTVALYTSQESRPGQSPEREAPHEEDCFCCCAHVLPSIGFGNLCYTEIKHQCAPAESKHLLSPALQSTYHPPRSA